MKMSQTKESLPTETTGQFLYNVSFLSSSSQMDIRTPHLMKLDTGLFLFSQNERQAVDDVSAGGKKDIVHKAV